MRVQLLPRLSAAGVSRILSESHPRSPRPLTVSAARDRYGGLISYGASGGARSVSAAGSIRDVVRTIADRHHFPDVVSQAERASFDTDVGVALADIGALDSGEGMRGDVWGFITVVLLPDVVAWRFPDLSLDRFKGGVRNALQRCWIRAKALDLGAAHPDRWSLLGDLSEDALVQIFERASLANDVLLAKTIAEIWSETAEQSGRSRMEALTRSAVKTIRLRNEILCLGALPPEDMEVQIREVFQTV